MGDEIEPLCCCEYSDLSNQRNHILACCCNCVDLDEGFDSLIRGEGFPDRNKKVFYDTLRDRMRIPWRGGAKQIAFDSILPIIILPITFLTAALSLWWTIFAFTAVIVILISIFRFFIFTIPRTKFFFVWTITSIVILYVIFQLIVIPFLEILLEENIVVSLFIILFVLFLYTTKNRNNSLVNSEENSGDVDFSALIGATYTKCSICQVMVPDKDHHCVWIDTCIGRHNQFHFILMLFFGFIALCYSSNLTLTTVCHPYVFYKTILLPDDCSDVYGQFEFGLTFVSAVYSLGIAILLLIMLLHQILLVSLGLSSKEWRNQSFCAKLFLGLCSKRPHSSGFIRNWKKIIFLNEGSSARYHHKTQI